MTKINLIPEVKQEKLRIHKLNSLVTTVAVSVGVVLAVVIVCLSIYAGILTAQKEGYNHDIAAEKDKIKTMSELEKTVANLENGLGEIKSITSGNKNWNNYLDLIEKYVPGDIQFTSMSVTGNQVSVNMNGKNVASIDRYLQSFSSAKNEKKENYFTNVSVNGYSLKDGGQVSFSSTFNLNEAAVW